MQMTPPPGTGVGPVPGGQSPDAPVAGGSENFSVMEVHQADVRVANSTLEQNADGANSDYTPLPGPADVPEIWARSLEGSITIGDLEWTINLGPTIDPSGRVFLTSTEPGCHLRALDEDLLDVGAREQIRQRLTFVIIGGGPTGVEAAAEIHDLVEEELVEETPPSRARRLSCARDAGPGFRYGSVTPRSRQILRASASFFPI